MEFDIATVIGALGLLGTTIGSYVRLSARITQLETELSNYRKVIDRLEADSEEHHETLIQQVSLLKDSIYTIKELILSSNSKFEVLQASLTFLHKTADNQDQRIFNLEQNQYANAYSKPFKPHGRGSNKD